MRIRRRGRRQFLTATGTLLLSAAAGCLSIFRTTSEAGTLRVRVRNHSSSSHKVGVRVYVNGEENASFAENIVLSPSGANPATEQFWSSAVKGIFIGTSYRVAAIVDGIRYEKSDTATCDPDSNAGVTETIRIAIWDNGTNVITGICSETPNVASGPLTPETTE